MCAKIDCFKVLLDVVIQPCSRKNMFLKSYSSAAVKFSRDKNKSATVINIFFKTWRTKLFFKNASRSKFLQNTKWNIAIDIKGWEKLSWLKKRLTQNSKYKINAHTLILHSFVPQSFRLYSLVSLRI